MSFTPPKPFTVTIAAGASKDIDGPGRFIRILTATGTLKIGFDLGTTFATDVGVAYQCEPGEAFTRVTLENPGVAAITVTVVIGRMIIFDDRLHVIGGALDVNGVGTDGTGIVQPTGGSGIRGWLSGIYDALSGGAITIDADLTGVATEATLADVLVALMAMEPAALTDAQLRAAAVAVSGPLTDAQLRATAVPVSGPLTDAQLRATAVPVSGPLTDAQLRASAVPVRDACATAMDSTTADVALNAVGGGGVLIKAANANRRSLSISNTGATFIRLGSAAADVNAGKGYYLAPGASVEIRNTCAIYGCGVGGAGSAAPVEETW